MCGITGFIDTKGNYSDDILASVIKRMNNKLIHRGPDDEGCWVDQSTGIALGHRRLSILDLSPQGHQPMVSVCARFVLVFNGEIYNHQAIRKELEKSGKAPAWRGHSDTEVMLAAIVAWGVASAVKRFIGMFAFALWDKKDRNLYLVRDRMGEKPLYYGIQRGVFLFSSELKALRVHPSWQGEIDRNSLSLYMRNNYIPAPYSIYRDVHKLQPGTILTISHQSLIRTNELPIPQPYWSVRQAALAGTKNVFQGTEDEAILKLDHLLRDAVKQQMEADVPLGAFLSGGIDSSTVVALMQTQSTVPVKTFSIGFFEKGYNEAKHAKAVAAHLGTEHTELYVTSEEAMRVIPRLPTLFDEPFSDSSQIPTFLVAQLARQHVTVSLSGDGGDELFRGYKRYDFGEDLWERLYPLPYVARKILSLGITSIPLGIWNAFGKWLQPVFTKYGRPAHEAGAGHKLYTLADFITEKSQEELYQRIISHPFNSQNVVKRAQLIPTVLNDETQWARLPDFANNMMYLDQISYLPDDILAKVDRSSMGVSLESRIPLLDHRIVEMAWRLPLSMKLRNGEKKWILKQVLYQYVPRELIDRPKMGFAVPVGEWLRGPLKDWAHSLLDEKKLRNEGYFFPKPIVQKWEEHLSGHRSWSTNLWDVLMFQAWLENENKG